MIVEECFFDPVRDIAPVEQCGFIDLKSALANSVVPSVMPDSDVDYNGVDDPDSIIGTPRDIFEAIDMLNSLQDATSAADSNGKDE